MASWPIVVIGLIIVCLLGWVGWTWLHSAMETRAAERAKACSRGDLAMRIAVTPAVEQAVSESVKRWNDQHPVVQDRCIHIDVTGVESEQVLNNLIGKWDEQLGPRPQAWLSDSSFWTNRLAAINSTTLTSTPESVAASPIVLALPEDAGSVMSAGKGYEWSQLPALVAAPNGWQQMGRADWGRLTLALPNPATNPASGLALQGALAGLGPWKGAPVSSYTLTQPAVQQGMAQLASSQPAELPKTTLDALVRLGDLTQVQGAPFIATPVTEVDLYRRNMGYDGKAPPKRPLIAVPGRGAAPNADFPLVALAGTESDQVYARATQRLRDFLREPAQQQEFARIGLRASGYLDHPSPSPGLRWDPPGPAMVPANPAATHQLVAAWYNATGGSQVVTIMVDVSKSMSQEGGDGKSRIAWVKQALNSLADWSTAGSMGLWAFSKGLSDEQPYVQLVPTKPIADNKAKWRSGVGALEPTSATYLNTSVEAVYKAALAGYVDGRVNRVIVITDGPNDGGMTFTQLRTDLRNLIDPNKKVSISAIAFGQEPNADELKELVNLTGGTFAQIADGKGLDATVANLLATAPR